ncbi:unnamed protein product [Choristocarpus tenellus]
MPSTHSEMPFDLHNVSRPHMISVQIFAARPGVVVAFCDHFCEGRQSRDLLPRANFIALRHQDGTYTRYVHLLPGGVLVTMGQEVEAGHLIGLSGNTGYSSTPHLHFDAVDLLPEETSQLTILLPKSMNNVMIPSIAAIFSGRLSCSKPIEALLVYAPHSCFQSNEEVPILLSRVLDHTPLIPVFNSTSSPATGTSIGDIISAPPPLHYIDQKIDQKAVPERIRSQPLPTHLPVTIRSGHSRGVVVLVDRGGGFAFQDVAEAAAGWCLTRLSQTCLGVVIANDRSGHEVFPMAPPKIPIQRQRQNRNGTLSVAMDKAGGDGTVARGKNPDLDQSCLEVDQQLKLQLGQNDVNEEEVKKGTRKESSRVQFRLPFPVVMVSRESGDLLKEAFQSSTATGEGGKVVDDEQMTMISEVFVRLGGAEGCPVSAHDRDDPPDMLAQGETKAVGDRMCVDIAAKGKESHCEWGQRDPNECHNVKEEGGYGEGIRLGDWAEETGCGRWWTEKQGRYWGEGREGLLYATKTIPVSFEGMSPSETRRRSCTVS